MKVLGRCVRVQKLHLENVEKNSFYHVCNVTLYCISEIGTTFELYLIKFQKSVVIIQELLIFYTFSTNKHQTLKNETKSLGSTKVSVL